ncbi:hypothetical protein HY641_01435 [Candidatus Woesearchaeota archaeon]|nr:hypothetical protein [Candidatus Woesearchaeota archaeon]
MSFQNRLFEGAAKKVPVDPLRARSLIRASDQCIKTAKLIPLTELTSKTILRESYESLRQYVEAIGYLKGYSFEDHAVMIEFIEEVLKNPRVASRFDSYRKIRNGINYYGDDVSLGTVKETLREIPRLIEDLCVHTSEQKRNE